MEVWPGASARRAWAEPEEPKCRALGQIQLPARSGHRGPAEARARAWVSLAASTVFPGPGSRSGRAGASPLGGTAGPGVPGRAGQRAVMAGDLVPSSGARAPGNLPAGHCIA